MVCEGYGWEFFEMLFDLVCAGNIGGDVSSIFGFLGVGGINLCVGDMSLR